MPIVIFTYNILYLLLLVIIFPFLLIAALLFEKYRAGFLNRFGIIPSGFKKKTAGLKNIWLHAASAGEVKSVLPLADELKKKYPGANIVFTTTGINGQRMLKKTSKDIPACYLPLDLYFFIKPLVNLIKESNNSKYKILGMQAVVRILTDKRCKEPIKQRVETLNEILPLMERPEDRQSVQSAITRINDSQGKK